MRRGGGEEGSTEEGAAWGSKCQVITVTPKSTSQSLQTIQQYM